MEAAQAAGAVLGVAGIAGVALWGLGKFVCLMATVIAALMPGDGTTTRYERLYEVLSLIMKIPSRQEHPHKEEDDDTQTKERPHEGA